MRPRHRFVTLIAATLLVLAACGGDDGADPSTPADTGAPGTDAQGTDAPADAATDTPDQPEVDAPGTDPEELTVTELVAGSGPEAQAGDTVVVDYVGVRSVDGVQFDSSYEGGRPFSVVLGQGNVIAGWDQGLVGVQTGGRYQLDIPSDLAYGASGAGELIPADTSLTFVVDVRAIYGPVDPADAPTDVSVDPLGNVDEVTVEDLVEGEGPAAATGDTLVINLIAYRADTGEVLDNTWDAGQPIEFPLAEGGESLTGMTEGLTGMQVGGRRLVRIPFAQAFGAEGNEQLGLPAETDLVLVVDLLAAY